MKLLVTCIFIVSNFVFAQSLPKLEGQFKFQPQYLKVVQARHHLLIQVQSETAKMYLTQLRNVGYSCQSVTGATLSCKKINSQIPENSKVRQAVIKKYENSLVNFDRAISDYALINDAPAVKEYQANQTSQMGQMKFNQTNILVLKDLVKIKLSKQGTSDVAYFNITPEGFLGSISQVSQDAKPSEVFISKETYVYLYELIYL